MNAYELELSQFDADPFIAFTATTQTGYGTDNAALEMFYKTLKAGLRWRHPRKTRRKDGIEIFEYVNAFCTPRQRHSAPGWKGPITFKRKVA